MNSRAISEPLKLLDCCLVSDGAAAVVVSAKAASDSDRAQVAILGCGQGHTHEHISAAPSLTDFGYAASARPRIFNVWLRCILASVTPEFVSNETVSWP